MKHPFALSAHKRREIETIKNLVCKFYNTPNSVFNNKARKKEVVRVKHTAIYLCYKNVSVGLETLSRIFKYTNHTTPLHAVRKIHSHITYHKELRHEVEQIQQQFKNI